MTRPILHRADLLRWSLVAVWLGTAAVSAIEWPGQSTALLADAGIGDARRQAALIGTGIAADLAAGLWLALRPGRPAYAAALVLMLGMTLAATVLQPALWLHPLGPLLKNLPIAAALWQLLDEERKAA